MIDLRKNKGIYKGFIYCTTLEELENKFLYWKIFKI